MAPTAAGRALLERFEAIRIVSLPDRQDRRREIEGEFARLGLPIDGDRIAFFDGLRFPEAAGFPTTGTRGCYMSHLGVLEQAVARGVRSVLLLEDDIDWARTAERDVPDALATLDTLDWAFFYGGLLGPGGTAPVIPGPPRVEIIPGEQGILGGHCIGFSAEAARVTAASLRAMAARAPGSDEGGPMHVDGAYGWVRRARPELLTAIALPPLCAQRPSRTDIHALGLKDRLPGVAGLVQLGRKARRQAGRLLSR